MTEKFTSTTWLESWWSRLTQEETNKLIVKAQNGDKEALGILVEDNMGLVITVANEINVKGRAEDYDGTIEEGVIALIKALKKFDVSLGYKTSTYVCHGIRVAMNHYIADGYASYDTIRITRHYNDLLKTILAFREAFIEEHCRKPTIDEISNGVNISRHEITKILQAKKGTLSFDYVADGNDSPLISFIVDTNCESESHIVNRVMLSQCISKLKEKEQRVLKMRYYQDMTLTNVSKELNMSLNGTKLLERRALSKLRKIIMGSDYPYETALDFKKRAW